MAVVEIPEEWRPIDDYPGYEVSSQGRVRSSARMSRRISRWGTPASHSLASRVLKPWCVGAGYAVVALGAKREHRRYVHQLVATAFHSRPSEEHQVNHKDGSKTNNAASNLEWVTRSQNAKHSTHVLGNRAGQFGHGRVRISA